jgi:hypothetical protein
MGTREKISREGVGCLFDAQSFWKARYAVPISLGAVGPNSRSPCPRRPSGRWPKPASVPTRMIRPLFLGRLTRLSRVKILRWPTTSPPLAPAASDLVPGQIDKSRLAIGAIMSFDAFPARSNCRKHTRCPVADHSGLVYIRRIYVYGEQA